MPNRAVQRRLACSATQQEVLAENPLRVYALLVNDGAADIYLAFSGPAAINTGIRLNNGGGSYEINLMNPWQGTVNAVGDATSPVLLITEW